LDQYFTPQPLADALALLLTRDGWWRGGNVIEPSAGKGAFVRAAYNILCARDIRATDIDLQRYEELRAMPECSLATQTDFVAARHGKPFSLILGNPPFSHAEDHVRAALAIRDPRFGAVAFLLRLAFLESADRKPFWEEHPASKIYVLSERPSFTGGGTDSAAYGFFVWANWHRGPTELEVISWGGNPKKPRAVRARTPSAPADAVTLAGTEVQP